MLSTGQNVKTKSIKCVFRPNIPVSFYHIRRDSITFFPATFKKNSLILKNFCTHFVIYLESKSSWHDYESLLTKFH